MSNLISDKALFSGKQMIGAITLGLLVGGGIARFELKMGNISDKMDTIIALIDTNRVYNKHKFELIDQEFLATKANINSITSSLSILTAMLKPEEITIKHKR